MRGPDGSPFLKGFWATSLGTLASRVLGILRDVATASLLGLAAGGGVMDAFVLAFRIPNLLRRWLGEGALAMSYLPVLTAELERDRAAGQALAVAVVGRLAGVLAVVLALGEASCGLAWLWSADPGWRLLVGLTAAMLPYLWFICIAAQLSATLQAQSRFGLPALAAALLNVGWLVGAWWIAPAVSPDKSTQAYVLAGCVLAAGFLQAAVQLPLLARLGFRLMGFRLNIRRRSDRTSTQEPCRAIVRRMAPLALALSVTQINTLVDSCLAWALAAPAGTTIGWLPGGVLYPLRTGATAALYYAERFYQLPVGLLGVAVATVIFPVLSRHAALGRRSRLAADLAQGLRLVCFAALPAAVGLILLAQPLARLLLERGAFTAADAARTARTIAAYGAGVWAYCTLPVITRGFYALGDMRAPLMASVAAMALNVGLDLALVWPLGEAGLALATALSAAMQAVFLMTLFSRLHGSLEWRRFGASAARASAATTIMSCLLAVLPYYLPEANTRWAQAGQLAALLLAGGGSFLLAARLLGCEELSLLLPRFDRARSSEPAEITSRAGRRAA